jgi:SAM-dependent methyltransferase
MTQAQLRAASLALACLPHRCPAAPRRSSHRARALPVLAEEPPEQVVARGWPPPRLYDLAIGGGRDFAGETAFMLACCARYGGGGPARTFLELGAGPGRHTRAAARAGLASVGVDLCPDMVAYARAQSATASATEGAGAPPVFQLGDMADLFAPDAPALAAGSFDIIACLFGSLSHMTELGMAAACFADCTRLLSGRGVLLVELDHPRDLFNGSTAHAARPDAAGGVDGWMAPVWSVGVPGGGSMQVQWGAPGDAFDAIRQTLQRTVVVTTRTPGALDAVHTSSVPVRLFTCPELALLGARAGLEVAAVYGGLDGSDGGAPDAKRLVVVFVADGAGA